MLRDLWVALRVSEDTDRFTLRKCGGGRVTVVLEALHWHKPAAMAVAAVAAAAAVVRMQNK
jgi:xanthine/CO dehydrogenase XdhC/CoxF family maturation factor